MKPKKPAKPGGKASINSPEIQQIEQLLQKMSEHNLEEFEYSRGDLRIRLKKPSAGIAMVSRPAPLPEIIVTGAPASSAPEAAAESGGSTGQARSTDGLHVVKSPIVGTFYASPSPGADPFVKMGAYVEAGQTLCIVEAMKLMNEIESDESGEVVRIFAENGQPVEYGQPLFGIRPSRKK
jgi:acetyl-CoA carboxylase biotin carboxyl carrier protein